MLNGEKNKQLNNMKYLSIFLFCLCLFWLLKACGAFPSKTFTEKDLRYKGRKLGLTNHARCRMDCRHIDAFEIQEIIEQNKVNEYKTRMEAQPCPSIAYEGKTRDGQYVRIVIGACNENPRVITVIDLDTEHECDCK